jgi:hypothetical protein
MFSSLFTSDGMWLLLWAVVVYASAAAEHEFGSDCNATLRACGAFEFVFCGSCRSLPRDQRMTRQLIVIDDFYSNPDEVRKQALKMSFGSTGYFPGRRTAPVMLPGVQATLEMLVGSHMTRWTNFHGSFQYTLENHTSWVHFDEAHWSGLVYLTPDAPLESGTRFFQHVETRLNEMPTEDDAQRLGVANADELKALLDDDKRNYSTWKVVDQVGNRFNRLLLFRGVRYHQSAEYFGTTLENGRLFQTFFFGLALNCLSVHGFS